MAVHKEFRTVMFAHDVKRDDLADILGKGLNYVSDRLTGRRSWFINDIHKIIAYFNELDPDDPPIPYSEIPIAEGFGICHDKLFG